MARWGSSVGIIAAAAVLLLLGSVPGWGAVIIRDGDPGTIGDAVTKPDGTEVALTCEGVLWCGKSGK